MPACLPRNSRNLFLKLSKWNSSESTLFDYEAKVPVVQNYNFIQYTLLSAYAVTCIEGELKVELLENLSGEERSKVLFIISPVQEGFIISPKTEPVGDVGVDFGKDSEAVWVVVKSISVAVLHQGDILRVGRCAFKVERLVQDLARADDFRCCSSETAETHMVSASAPVDKQLGDGNVQNGNLWNGGGDLPACRICLGGPDIEELVTPCTCKGSLQWVHLACLRSWMRERLHSSQSPSGLFGGHCLYWQSLDCELCKEPYPSYVKVIRRSPSDFQNTEPGTDAVQWIDNDNSQVDQILSRESFVGDGVTTKSLVDLPNPRPPYLVIHSMDTQSQHGGYYFINLEPKRALVVGRGHDVDIRVSDISVSRAHMVLRYDFAPSPSSLYPECKFTTPSSGALDNPLGQPLKSDMSVVLNDAKSKFGTLLLLNNREILIKNKQSVKLQVGNRLITVEAMRKSWKTMFPNSCISVSD